MEKNRDDILMSVRDLWVSYTSGGEKIHAVNGVSFDLKRGSTLGLVGETGAGKTTIAKTILHILPELQSRVEGGEVILDGENLEEKTEKELRAIRGKKIAMIFQDPMTALNPVKRVGTQISDAIRFHSSVSKGEARAQAEEMLKMVGIPAARYSEYPHQFSGGMKQRVVIAMALACSPELLLADEPTTALDVTIQAQVLEMISDLKEKNNTSMLLITHDLGIVAEVCDDVAVIYAGEIVEYGTKADIFHHPAHPYTRGLFSAIPSLTGHVRRLSPVAGMPPDPAHLPQGCHFNPRCPHVTPDCCQGGGIPFREIAPGHFCRCRNCES